MTAIVALLVLRNLGHVGANTSFKVKSAMELYLWGVLVQVASAGASRLAAPLLRHSGWEDHGRWHRAERQRILSADHGIPMGRIAPEHGAASDTEICRAQQIEVGSPTAVM
jgi:hypothetical protein